MIAALEIGGYVLGMLLTAFVLGVEDPDVWANMDRRYDYSPVAAVLLWPLAWALMIPIKLVTGATSLGALCAKAVTDRRARQQHKSEIDAALVLSESGYRQSPARCPHCRKFLAEKVQTGEP